jgi:hypothetical protein
LLFGIQESRRYYTESDTELDCRATTLEKIIRRYLSSSLFSTGKFGSSHQLRFPDYSCQTTGIKGRHIVW